MIPGRLFSGDTWVYQATVINGAAIATPTVTLTPGAGKEFELYWGRISHNDATASTVRALIRDAGARTLATLIELASVTQNSVNQFPTAPQAAATGGNEADSPAATRFLISSTMDLRVEAVDIDASEGITVVIVGRTRGGVPTVAETGGGTPTITINTEGIF